MKKNYDYEKTKNWVSTGFLKVERDVKYNGGATDALYGPETREKKEREGFFRSPGMQIAACFLVAALVGGGAFAALKSLERIGGGLGPGGSPEFTDTGSEADSSRIDGASEVVYGEHDPTVYHRYVAVYSGGKVYYPIVRDHEKTEYISFDEIRTGIYDQTTEDDITIRYNGDFAIKDNVKDRDWHVISVSVYDPNPGTDESAHITETTVEGVTELLSSAEDGLYCVGIEATWDKYTLEHVGDSAMIYSISFFVEKTDEEKKTAADEFSDVVEVDLISAEYSDELWPVLEIDGGIGYSIRMMTGEAAESLKNYGYTVLSYKINGKLRFCVHGKDNGVLFCITEETYSEPIRATLIYADKTPAGHPAFFTLYDPDLTTYDARLYRTVMSVYDTVTKEKKVIDTSGLKRYLRTDAWSGTTNAAYSDPHIIFYTVAMTEKDKNEGRKTYGSRIVWDGEKYVPGEAEYDTVTPPGTMLTPELIFITTSGSHPVRSGIPTDINYYAGTDVSFLFCCAQPGTVTLENCRVLDDKTGETLFEGDFEALTQYIRAESKRCGGPIKISLTSESGAEYVIRLIVLTYDGPDETTAPAETER